MGRLERRDLRSPLAKVPGMMRIGRGPGSVSVRMVQPDDREMGLNGMGEGSEQRKV